MDHPFDSAILSKTGMNEQEATDFVQKRMSYLGSLSPNQYAAAARTGPSWADAAKAIDPNMTAADLQDFVARRSSTPPGIAMCLCFPKP